MEVTKIRELEKCLWKHMSKDKNSSTFKDVENKKSHHLKNCKYECNGIDNGCCSYKPLKDYPDSVYFRQTMIDYYNRKSITDANNKIPDLNTNNLPIKGYD